MSVLETIATTDAVTRVRVLAGEDTDAGRSADKTPIGKSDCTYHCPDAATAERCIEALRESDERLRSRPEELMLWDWQATYWEAEPGNPDDGGTVLLRRLVRTGVLRRPARRLVRRCTSTSTRSWASRWRTLLSPTGR